MRACDKCGGQMPEGALYCVGCGSRLDISAPSHYMKDAAIVSFTLHAAAGVGEAEQVCYENGMLTYRCSGIGKQPTELSASFIGRGFDALCEAVRESRIDGWTGWDASLPPPLGSSMPRIELTFKDGTVINWQNRSVPRSEAWRRAEYEISRALGIDFRMEGGATSPRKAWRNTGRGGSLFVPSLVACRALMSPYVMSHARRLRAGSDTELDRLYHYGADGIPGSVVEAVMNASRKHPGMSDFRLSLYMRSDAALMERLEKNLEWESKTPELSDALRRFVKLLEDEGRTLSPP